MKIILYQAYKLSTASSSAPIYSLPSDNILIASYKAALEESASANLS